MRSVAKKFGVSIDDAVVGQQAQSKSSLKVGQELRIPPVSGLVYTVKDTDTLDSVAKRFTIDSAKVVELNGLEDPTLVVGQVLVLPGRQGAAEARRPKPTPEARAPASRPVAAAAVAAAAVAAAAAAAVQLLRRPVPLAGHRRRQLHQPVLPLRATRRSTSRRDYGATVVSAAARQGRSSPAGSRTAAATRSGSPTAAACTRRTTTCRRSSRRQRAERRPAASRSGASARAAWPPARTSTSRSGAAGPVERRHAGQPAAVLLGPSPPRARHGPGGAPCDNADDVPRRCPDLRARRCGRRRSGDDAPRGPRPARRSRRRRRRAGRLRLPPRRRRPDRAPRLPLQAPLPRDARRPRRAPEAPRQGRRRPVPRGPAGHGGHRLARPAR